MVLAGTSRCQNPERGCAAGACGRVSGGSSVGCGRVENNITTPEVVVRTSLQRRIGGYDPRLPATGDQEMWMRLAAHGDVGFLRGVDQAFYRVHGQNMRSTISGLTDLRQKRFAFEITLDLYRDRLTDPQRLADGIHRRLSRQALAIATRL